MSKFVVCYAACGQCRWRVCLSLVSHKRADMDVTVYGCFNLVGHRRSSEDTVFPQDAKLGLVRFKGSTVSDLRALSRAAFSGGETGQRDYEAAI